jgi:hypothetical protein
MYFYVRHGECQVTPLGMIATFTFTSIYQIRPDSKHLFQRNLRHSSQHRIFLTRLNMSLMTTASPGEGEHTINDAM